MSRKPLRWIAGVAASVALTAVTLFIFLDTNVGLKPHDVRVGFVGPPSILATIEDRVAARAPGAIRFERYPSEAAARTAILDREAHGALVIGNELKLLLSSAASPPIARVLEAALARPNPSGTIPKAIDINPIADNDRGGLVLNFVVLALMISGTLAALVAYKSQRAAGGLRQLSVAAAACAAGGVACGLLVGPVTDALDAPLLVVSALCAGTLFAAAAITLPLLRVAGETAGVGLAFTLNLMIGQASAGAVTGPEMLPPFWAAIHPYMPAGAAADALRSITYFDGVALTSPLVVIAAWALAGTGLLVVPALLAARQAPAVRAVAAADAAL